MYQIVLVDSQGNADAYAAGDPTPGRGANEFATREEAEAAIPHLETPAEGQRWEARERR
jgi:hypothetical protein